jgi:tetratricopeptide (TPR) repeat protein
MDRIYRCFEVRISPTEAGSYVVEGRYRDTIRYSSFGAVSTLFEEGEISKAKEWLERGLIDKSYSIDFGKRLFQLLFSGDVLDLYREALNDIDPGCILVNALDFPVPMELAGIPWELIYDPKDNKGFLARSPNSPFVRHYTNLPKSNDPPKELPLRVLILAASPPGKPQISEQRETEDIDQLLSKRQLKIVDIVTMAVHHLMKTHSLKGFGRRILQRRLVEVEVLPHATYQKIKERLSLAKSQNRDFHIIHFIGHGQENGGGLKLEAEPGKPPDISATDFAELFKGLPVSLVVLNACETAGADCIHNISEALLHQGIPLVVGMQIKVPDETALDFGREFYRMWATGEPIQSALAEARQLMTNLSPRAVSDWSIPVLYMGPLGHEAGMELKLAIPKIKPPWFINIPRQTVGVYLFLIGLLSSLFFTGPQLNLFIRTQMPVIKCIFPYPMKDDPSFNIVIAPFTIVNQDKYKLRNTDGFILANDVYWRLKENVNELDIKYFDIREPGITCPIGGQTPEKRQQAASKLAKRIQADVLIYGSIELTSDVLKVTPEFYVNYEGFEQGEEIAGVNQLGSTVELDPPISEVKIQNGSYIQLVTREKVLIHVIRGLSYITLDKYENAMNHFRTAESLLPSDDSKSKAVLFLLMGGTSQSMATLIRDITPEEYQLRLNEARNYYQQAHDLGKPYARAQLGLANVLYLEALGDPYGEGDNIDLDKLMEAEKNYRVALQMSNAPESANIPSKVHYGLGLIYLARGQFDPANSEFLQVVEHFQGGDESLENLASHAYARLGWIASQRRDYPKALELISLAINHASPYYRVRYTVLLGDTYWKEGDLESACKTYQTAIVRAKSLGDQKTIQDLQSITNNPCSK